MENIGSPPGKEITFINFDVDWQQENVAQQQNVSHVSRLKISIQTVEP